jgi:hypothetical protein
MKQVAVVTILVIGGVLAWILGSRLSADALGMAVGLLFGVLAGVPTALLVMASGRRRQDDENDFDEDDDEPGPYGRQRIAAQPYPYQPPVIVLAAPQAAPAHAWGQQPPAQTVDSVGYPVRQALPGPGAPGAPAGRVFRVVGEREEMLDDW